MTRLTVNWFHLTNWVDCIRSRQQPTAPIEAESRLRVRCSSGEHGHAPRRLRQMVRSVPAAG